MAGKQSNLHRNPLEHGTWCNYSLLKRKENTAVGLEGKKNDKGPGTLSSDGSAFHSHLHVWALGFGQRGKNTLISHNNSPLISPYHEVGGLFQNDK